MADSGDSFTKWCEHDLPFRRFTKRLECGKDIDVRVRETWAGDFQWFIGVYEITGLILVEEFNGNVQAVSESAAMTAGLARAYRLAGDHR